MSDLCGIFFVNVPGVYTLNKNLDDIHDRDQTGVLARAEPVAADDSAVAGQGESEDDSAVAGLGEDSDESEDDSLKRHGGFDSIQEEAGPGNRLETYLPKRTDLTANFSESLTLSKRSAAVAATHNDRKVDGIKFKEKRLDAGIWRCKGVHQRGSHFPICVFTNNVGRRSPQKLEERRQKQMQRSWRGSQWWAQGSREGCRARTQDSDPQQGRQSRPRGDFPAVAREWTAVAGDRRRMGRQGETHQTQLIGGDWGAEAPTHHAARPAVKHGIQARQPGQAAGGNHGQRQMQACGPQPRLRVRVWFCSHGGEQNPMDKMS